MLSWGLDDNNNKVFNATDDTKVIKLMWTVYILFNEVQTKSKKEYKIDTC